MPSPYQDVLAFAQATGVNNTRQYLNSIIVQAPKAASNQMPGYFAHRVLGPSGADVYRKYDNRFESPAININVT